MGVLICVYMRMYVHIHMYMPIMCMKRDIGTCHLVYAYKDTIELTWQDMKMEE